MNPQGATEFEPSIEWVNEDDCDTLLVYLPGFLKEQLKVQLRSRTLILIGQRKLQDNTWTLFRKEFILPEHCDISKINAKFEGNILYVKQPKLPTQVAKQDQNPPMNAPTPTPKDPIDEPKVHQEQAKAKHESEPTSMTQPDGNYGVGKNVKDGPEKVVEEKDGNYEGKVGEVKDPKSVCENASKKTGGGSDVVMKLKLSRNDVVKVLALVLGFVVGVYCTKSVLSWIGY